MHAICVFCGSNAGNNPAFVEAARAVGEELGKRSLTLVYGGGGKGMMGAVADGALAAAGKVISVIPHWLIEKESAHKGVTRMIRVETMLERKARMIELADAFLVLPGGLGTLDELFEIATWSQLAPQGTEKHQGIFNVAGYFYPIAQWLDNAVAQGFIRSDTPGMPLVSSNLTTLLEHFLHPE